jgi:alanyl-tRNA synthetase
MALFGEKYGDVVRMVDIGGPWSRELCAGTHVARSSQIGAITLIGESSVSSTARRVEALVGQAAVADFSVEKAIMRRLSSLLKTPREELPQRVEDLVAQVKNLERAVAKTQQEASQAVVPSLIAQAVAGSITHVIATVPGVSSADDLRSIAQGVLSGVGDKPSVVALTALFEGRAMVVVAANAAGVAQGAHAGNMVKEASIALGGGGGGKPALAQGGGPNGDQLEQAMVGLRQAVDSL